MKQFGHFVNIASTAAYLVLPTMSVYAGTKIAVRAISEGLRQEAGDKLRVTIISPGITRTNFAEAMVFFIDHLPPTLHVMLLTRSEPPLPLLHWRARGEVQDIHTADLRFSLEETTAFLHQVGKASSMPAPSLSKETIQQLTERLEGWAAGLRLLLLTLQGHKGQHEVWKTACSMRGVTGYAPYASIETGCHSFHVARRDS